MRSLDALADRILTYINSDPSLEHSALVSEIHIRFVVKLGMSGCKVHEKQTSEYAKQCRADLQKISSANLHTAAVACCGYNVHINSINSSSDM